MDKIEKARELFRKLEEKDNNVCLNLLRTVRVEQMLAEVRKRN